MKKLASFSPQPQATFDRGCELIEIEVPEVVAPDPKEHRKTRAEMIAKSHREGDVQTLARAIVNLYDHVDELTRQLEAAKRKIKSFEKRISELEN